MAYDKNDPCECMYYAEAETRIAELEAALREAHAIVPGGSCCDPQWVADEIRAIAARVGVQIEDE